MLIVAVGLAGYANSFRGVLIFDDNVYIRDNPRIRHLGPPWEVLTNSSRPFVELTLALNYAVTKLELGGYHAVNLAVHVLAALTLFGLVRRTLTRPPLGERCGAAAPWLALAVALVWVVHPVQTESVTYLIQRAESLAGLFYLLILYCLVRSAEAGRPSWWFTAAVACGVLGMASKPVMATVPVMALLYDRFFLSGSFREAWRRRRPLYVGLAATWLLLPVFLIQGAKEWQETAGFDSKAAGPLAYAATQAGVILHYLRLAVWPRSLCLDYSWPTASSAAEVLWPALGIGLLLLGTGWAVWRHRHWGFVSLWFFLTLAPTSSFIPVFDNAVEHRLYLPLAAVVTLVVLAAYCGGRSLAGRWRVPVPWLIGLGAALLTLVVTTLGYATVQRNQLYHSDLTLWADTVQKRPDNARAHTALGVALTKLGKTTEAVAEYREALRLNPVDSDAHVNLAVLLMRSKQPEDAIRHYREALRSRPSNYKAHNNLGIALASRGQIEEAREHYLEAIRLSPSYSSPHNNLGVLHAAQGKLDEAVASYQEALRREPNYADAHRNLANALVRRGQLTEAVAHYRDAVRFSPRQPVNYYLLGTALARLGQTAEARQQFQKALKLRPNYPAARKGLEQLGQSSVSGPATDSEATPESPIDAEAFP